MKRRSFLFGLGGIGLAACSAGPAPASAAVNDPSSPHAPEGAPPPAAKTKVAEGGTYVCPMHPEVTSPQPALCPKCNMKLVPKG